MNDYEPIVLKNKNKKQKQKTKTKTKQNMPFLQAFFWENR